MGRLRLGEGGQWSCIQGKRGNTQWALGVSELDLARKWAYVTYIILNPYRWWVHSEGYHWAGYPGFLEGGTMPRKNTRIRRGGEKLKSFAMLTFLLKHGSPKGIYVHAQTFKMSVIQLMSSLINQSIHEYTHPLKSTWIQACKKYHLHIRLFMKAQRIGELCWLCPRWILYSPEKAIVRHVQWRVGSASHPAWPSGSFTTTREYKQTREEAEIGFGEARSATRTFLHNRSDHERKFLCEFKKNGSSQGNL